MAKDFLTYNQQMKYLRDSKKISCNGSKEKSLLVSHGYFNLVNGYKNPFVSATINGSHKYYVDTNIGELVALKEFDDNLRLLLLKYITKVEEEVRSLVAYSFDNYNDKGKIPWYSIDAYDSNKDATKVVKVISDSYSEINRSRQEYVKYYLENHNIIPTWILVKTIKFSTLIDLIKYSKNEVKDSLCNLYKMIDTNTGKNDYTLLLGSLSWFRIVRNSCAHNERIYTMSNGGRINSHYFDLMSNRYLKERTKKIIDAIVFMKYYLEKDDFERMVKALKKSLDKLKSKIKTNAFEKVRADLGIKDIGHLELLLLSSKKIEYNKF